MKTNIKIEQLRKRSAEFTCADRYMIQMALAISKIALALGMILLLLLLGMICSSAFVGTFYG